MVAQDILVVLVLVRTQVSQPKTSPENHFRGCLYFTIIRTLSFYLGSTYIRCGHTYTPSRHEIKRHTTLRQTRLILPLFFSAPNDFSISGKRFFVLRQTEWSMTERCPKYLSDHKSLYDKHIPYNLKNERTFPKTLGRDIYCAKVTPNPYVTSHLHTVNADKHWPHEIHHLLHHKTGDAVLTSPKCFWYVILVNVSQPSYHSLYRFPDG